MGVIDREIMNFFLKKKKNSQKVEIYRPSSSENESDSLKSVLFWNH